MKTGNSYIARKQAEKEFGFTTVKNAIDAGEVKVFRNEDRPNSKQWVNVPDIERYMELRSVVTRK